MTAGDSVRFQDMCNELKAQLEAYRNVLPKQDKVQKLLKKHWELYNTQRDCYLLHLEEEFWWLLGAEQESSRVMDIKKVSREVPRMGAEQGYPRRMAIKKIFSKAPGLGAEKRYSRGMDI